MHDEEIELHVEAISEEQFEADISIEMLESADTETTEVNQSENGVVTSRMIINQINELYKVLLDRPYTISEMLEMSDNFNPICVICHFHHVKFTICRICNASSYVFCIIRCQQIDNKCFKCREPMIVVPIR